jgi:hypothetical protein
LKVLKLKIHLAADDGTAFVLADRLAKLALRHAGQKLDNFFDRQRRVECRH